MAKILLVEDDTNLSEIYQARMEAEGYTVVAAADGETALALAAKEKPDLILSDVMMPKISGFEMLDILRNTDGLKHTRVIMLTALGQAEDKTRAESLGADRYLVKSQVTLEDIVSAAQELLGDGEDNLPTPAEMAQPTVTAAPTATPTPDPIATPVAAAPVQPAPSEPLTATTPAALATTPAPANEPATTEVQGLIEPLPAADVPSVEPAAEHASAPTPVTTIPAVQPAPDPTPVAAPEPPVAVTPAPVTDDAPASTPTPALETTPPVPAAAVTPAPDPTPALPDPAPQPEPTAEPITTTAIDEKVVASAIDKLLSKAPESPTVDKADVSPDSSSDDRSHGKIIAPIPRPSEPTLQELVAREENAEVEAASILAKAQAANNSDSAKKSADFDPNSISL